MTEDKNIKVRRKPRPKYDPNNKEQANTSKKRRWKKHHKKPKKDLGKSLQELQALINSKYHSV